MLVGGVYSGRGLSLLCPLGWVDWDWDGLSWMRVEMGWGWGQYLCHRSATLWRLLPLVSARFPVVRLYKVTIHSNILEVHLCTRNTCTMYIGVSIILCII